MVRCQYAIKTTMHSITLKLLKLYKVISKNCCIQTSRKVTAAEVVKWSNPVCWHTTCTSWTRAWIVFTCCRKAFGFLLSVFFFFRKKPTFWDYLPVPTLGSQGNLPDSPKTLVSYQKKGPGRHPKPQGKPSISYIEFSHFKILGCRRFC